MTAQTVTRDEFEDVKQLLASAARYAESANEKIDRVATQQELNTSAIAVLSQQLTTLTGTVNQLTADIGELRITIESVAQEAQQDRSQAAIDRAEFRSTVTQLLEVLTRQFNGNGRGEG